MKIVDQKCNYQFNPIGISLENIVFTWKCAEALGTKSVKTKFILAEDDKFEKVLHQEESSEIACPYHPEFHMMQGKHITGKCV